MTDGSGSDRALWLAEHAKLRSWVRGDAEEDIMRLQNRPDLLHNFIQLQIDEAKCEVAWWSKWSADYRLAIANWRRVDNISAGGGTSTYRAIGDQRESMFASSLAPEIMHRSVMDQECFLLLEEHEGRREERRSLVSGALLFMIPLVVVAIMGAVVVTFF